MTTSLACRSRILRLVACAAVLVPLWALTGPAAAADDISAEQQLAERYAPVVRLVTQAEDCGAGEPFQPSSVDPLFDNDSVALRGPWTSRDLIEVAPSADDLAQGLPGYSLDFPGSPLKPGCDYEKWAAKTWADAEPTTYAHIATEEDYPGKLALQYWFYYPFNDYNNKHESDWERIQIEFDAADAAAALGTSPTRVVYSEHTGSEQAAWDDSKLERVDDTHPVVYVSAGSHANHFEPALYLGRSSSQGLGCDSTIGADTVVRPVPAVVPSDPEAALEAYPWLDYEGKWGEQQPREFYSGPGGPAQNKTWNSPFTWSADASNQSYRVPGGGVYGVKATNFFCGAIGEGSVAALRFTANPGLTLGILAAILVSAIWLIRRTSWRTAPALPANRRRTVGETIAAAWAIYRSRPLLFLGIGLVVAVVSAVTSLARQVVAAAPSAPGASDGTASTVIGMVSIPLVGYLLMLSQAATFSVLVDMDAGVPTGFRRAYRTALSHWWPLLLTGLTWAIIVIALTATVFLLVVALLVALVCVLYVPVVVHEGRKGPRALWRSWKLVKPQFFKVLVVVVFVVAVMILISGLLGTAVLLLFQAPFVVVNLLPGVISALLGPFLALAMSYLYFGGVAIEESPEPPKPDAVRDVEPADSTP